MFAINFADIVAQPRRVLTTPTWSGLHQQGAGLFALYIECGAVGSLAHPDGSAAFLPGP